MLSKLLLTTFLASTTLARNDWSKPCFSGECSYDLPSQAGGPVGSLKIVSSNYKSPVTSSFTTPLLQWGTNKHAITDITPASGWVILGCDPNALEQNVRIVCQKDESDVNSCGHLFLSFGKSGKIVRLPETVGQRPPAHIQITYFLVTADSAAKMHLVVSPVFRLTKTNDFLLMWPLSSLPLLTETTLSDVSLSILTLRPSVPLSTRYLLYVTERPFILARC